MKKNIFLFLLILICCVGCTTSKLTWTPAQPGTKSGSGNQALYHLQGMNSGIYLFYFLPLWSGSPTSPNWQEYDCFHDRLSEKYVHMLMNSRNRQLNADRIDDLSMQWHSSGIWGLWIFWKRWVTATATAVEKEEK